jgi:hypothetical protein
MDAIERYRLRSLTDDQRREYEERVAICVLDGGLADAAAKELAWAQMRSAPTPDRPRSTWCQPSQ